MSWGRPTTSNGSSSESQALVRLRTLMQSVGSVAKDAAAIIEGKDGYLRRRINAGLARKMQLDLIGLALECMMGDVKDFLCVAESGSEKEIKEAERLLTLRKPLIRFLVGLRAESVEYRIWRYLMEDSNQTS